MVCTLGRGRMSAMVRLLTVGSFPEITSADEATHEKVAVQAIHRDLSDADEANLLEEEDMHVFGSRPLTDPLHLVCCNACKKPIKASRYAAHAERCRSLNSLEDTALGLDGCTGPKKPPRKGRKSLQGTNCNNRRIVGEQEKFESMDGNDVAGAMPNFDQSHILSSLSEETQTPAAPVPCPQIILDAPVPLATKTYHSQKNHRLRLALGHLYRGAPAEEYCHDSNSPELMQEKTALSSQVASPSKPFHEVHKDGLPQKILPQSSEVCSGASGGLPSSINTSNQLRENGFSRHGLQVAAAPVGMVKARYHSAPYSYSRNTGAALGTMQQVN